MLKILEFKQTRQRVKNKQERRSREIRLKHRSGTELEAISDALALSPIILLNPYVSFNISDRKFIIITNNFLTHWGKTPQPHITFHAICLHDWPNICIAKNLSLINTLVHMPENYLVIKLSKLPHH